LVLQPCGIQQKTGDKRFMPLAHDIAQLNNQKFNRRTLKAGFLAGRQLPGIPPSITLTPMRFSTCSTQ